MSYGLAKLVLGILFGVWIPWYFICTQLCLWKEAVFISSLQICMSFISFSWLIVLAGTFIMILKRNGDSGQPSLVSDLRRKASVCRFVIGALYRLRKFSSIPNLLSFYYKWTLNFAKCFLCSIWNGHVVFSSLDSV